MKFMIKHNLPLVRGGSLVRAPTPSCNGHPTALPPNVNPRTATAIWDKKWDYCVILVPPFPSLSRHVLQPKAVARNLFSGDVFLCPFPFPSLPSIFPFFPRLDVPSNPTKGFRGVLLALHRGERQLQLPQTHFYAFRAHGTCMLAANVVLFRLRKI